MRGNFMRFQAQYLRRIRLPRWEDLEKSLQKSLVKLGKKPSGQMDDSLVKEVYHLGDGDRNLLLPKKG
jgi:hypothetical protein